MCTWELSMPKYYESKVDKNSLQIASEVQKILVLLDFFTTLSFCFYRCNNIMCMLRRWANFKLNSNRPFKKEIINTHFLGLSIISITNAIMQNTLCRSFVMNVHLGKINISLKILDENMIVSSLWIRNFGLSPIIIKKWFRKYIRKIILFIPC